MLYHHNLSIISMIYIIDGNPSCIISFRRGISEMPEEEWHMSCFVAGFACDRALP